MKRFLQPNGAVVEDIQDTLAKASDGSLQRGAVDRYSFDGSGVGSNLFTTIALWMFGTYISSIVLLYLVFIGISVAAFALRYQDKRLIVVPLYCSVVTVMLLTPLCTSHLGIDQNPIGGQRYFALAPFLPTLHIFFELIERFDAVGKRKATDSLLLLIQGILLFGAFLVRSSTAYMFGVLVTVVIWRVYRNRREHDQLRRLAYKTSIVGTAFVLWAGFVVTMLPAYVQTGRVFSVFWHRAFISFFFHPDWPFGDLTKVYDCTQYIPEGLNRITQDRNGHCIWMTYPPNAKRPVQEVVSGVYGGEYEKALRNAYFYVLIHYPKKVFELYFYIKSQMIKSTLVAALKFLLALAQAPVAKGLFVIVATQLMLFIAFAIAIGGIDLQLAIFPILFLSSIAPLYVGWASMTTTTDTIFLMYSCLVLAVVLCSQSLIVANRTRLHR
jgi:hypothetical protein